MTTDVYYDRLQTLYATMLATATDQPGRPGLWQEADPGDAGYTAPSVATIDTTADGVPVRVYLPAHTDGGAPLLVWCHGGAFVGGDLDMPEADATAREVCVRAEAVVVSVDYRLAVEGVHYPLPHKDVVAAYRWAVRQAGAYGADPTRITLGGASAGANLAAGAALRLRDTDGSLPAGLLLLYPAVHPALPPASAELRSKLDRLSPAAAFEPEILEPVVENYLGAPVAEADGYAMPGVAEDLSGLPPTSIVNCEYDGLRASGERFADQLRDAGVDVVSSTVADVAHGHINRPGLPQAAQTWADMADWVGAR